MVGKYDENKNLKNSVWDSITGFLVAFVHGRGGGGNPPSHNQRFKTIPHIPFATVEKLDESLQFCEAELGKNQARFMIQYVS